MSDFISVGGATPPATDRVGVNRSETLPSAPSFATMPSSPLRFSAELQAVLAQSPFRLARLHAIRGEIENGTFETPERLRATADRLLDVIA